MITDIISDLGDISCYSFEKNRAMSGDCRGCSNNHFIDDTQTGDRICTSCGAVQLQNMLSEEPEWRTYKEEGMIFNIQYYFIGNADDDARVNTFTNSYLQSDSLST